MMAKPMKTLELHYPMIQFLIIDDIRTCLFIIAIFADEHKTHKQLRQLFYPMLPMH